VLEAGAPYGADRTASLSQPPDVRDLLGQVRRDRRSSEAVFDTISMSALVATAMHR
jgi:hypothetical protein